MFDFIAGWIGQGGLAAVAAMMLLENVFPPIPSELVMPLAGFEAAQGTMSMAGVILAGTLGSVAGALLWYWLGWRLGEARLLRLVDRHGAWLTVSRDDAEAAIAWFRRHGSLAVLVGRMVPGVRTLISVPAGLSGMRVAPFLLFTALGSLAWTSVLAFAGFLLRENYDRVETWLNPVTTVIVVAVVALYLWRVARGLLARR